MPSGDFNYCTVCGQFVHNTGHVCQAMTGPQNGVVVMGGGWSWPSLPPALAEGMSLECEGGVWKLRMNIAVDESRLAEAAGLLKQAKALLGTKP